MYYIADADHAPAGYATSGPENYSCCISFTWWRFATAALPVTTIALATVSFYAAKAAVADPVKSLRAA